MKLSLTAVFGLTLFAVFVASGGVGYYMSSRYEQLVDEGTLAGDARTLRALASNQIWTGHYRTVAAVAQAISQGSALRSAVSARDTAAITTALRDEYGRGAISLGQVVVYGATILDPDMRPIAAEWRKQQIAVPDTLLQPLAKRQGAERMQLAQIGWSSSAGPVQTVVAPVGGLRLAGYIALHVDPVPELKGIEQQLRMNVRVYPLEGQTPLLTLSGIPDAADADIVETRIALLGPDDSAIADIVVGRDLATLHSGLLRTRLKSLAVFVGIVGSIGAAALFMTIRYMSAMRRREEQQALMEAQLRSEREEAEQASIRQAKEQEAAYEAQRQIRELDLQQSVGVIVDAATIGDLSQRINTGKLDGASLRLAEDINRLLKTTESAISDVGAVLTPLAAGDTSGRVTTEYQGLFGTLRQNTNQLAGQLDHIGAQLVQTASQLHGAAAEISAGSNDLAQRTEDQAASIGETAASMQQITATVKQNSDKAQTASTLARTARDTADEGGTITRSAVEAVGRLEESAKRIAEIVGLIDEIAFQTNLLALNASVEAARAGEAGKGFAVVAQEVRALAQRSANASRDIKGLIQMSDGHVKTGAALVNQAGDSLSRIVVAITQVSDLIAEIAAASREQSVDLDRVNRTISSIDEMTQRNAALVEQTTASAQALSDQATSLNEVLRFFRR